MKLESIYTQTQNKTDIKKPNQFSKFPPSILPLFKKERKKEKKRKKELEEKKKAEEEEEEERIKKKHIT